MSNLDLVAITSCVWLCGVGVWWWCLAMLRQLALLVLLAVSCHSLQLAPGHHPALAAPRANVVMVRKPWETANVPLGRVSMNPLKNLQQMQDQRVASASHIVLAPVKCTLPLEEAKELLRTWKEEIGMDREKFAARAKTDSHCPTAASGGELGFMVRANLGEQFDDIMFGEEPGKVYGPIMTPKGLHIIMVHSCREPTSRSEAALGLPFSIGAASDEKK